MIEHEIIQEKNAKERQALVNAYKKVFLSEAGQKVLADMEVMCGLHSVSAKDCPYKTYFYEGRRSVILEIKSKLKGK